MGEMQNYHPHCFHPQLPSPHSSVSYTISTPITNTPHTGRQKQPALHTRSHQAEQGGSVMAGLPRYLSYLRVWSLPRLSPKSVTADCSNISVNDSLGTTNHLTFSVSWKGRVGCCPWPVSQGRLPCSFQKSFSSGTFSFPTHCLQLHLES